MHLIIPFLRTELKKAANPKKAPAMKAYMAHLFHRDQTNTKLLEETILLLIHEKEFFIRKAIGWVLRQYAYTNPKWVIKFVKKYEKQLSGLSKREAMKRYS